MLLVGTNLMLVRPVWLLYDDGRVYIRGAWGEETKWTRLDYENTKTRLDRLNTKTRLALFHPVKWCKTTADIEASDRVMPMKLSLWTEHLPEWQ